MQGQAESTRGNRRPDPALPTSVVSHWINLLGLASLGASIVIVLVWQVPPPLAASLMLAAYALPIMVLDILVARVHRRDSTGLDWHSTGRPNATRVLIKLIGATGTIAAVVLVHVFVRIYEQDDLRAAGLYFLAWSPVVLPAAFAYFYLIDGRMRSPLDGYWHTGRLMLGRWQAIDRVELKNHAMGWIVKGFFLPIMIVYLIGTLKRLHQYDWSTGNMDLFYAVRMLTDSCIAMELAIVCVGYACTMRLFDSHIRSTNPFLLGWLVTLAMYEPFNQIVTGTVLVYRNEHDWSFWLADSWLALPWSLALGLSFCTWLWATAIFGLRWSNLTNRGIITNGPYRFTKHPDYVSKVAFYWLANMPFLSLVGPSEGIRGAAAMIGVTLIYYGRARMEEKHLSEEPNYRAYALAMNERSLFARLNRWIPALRYRPGSQ